MKTSMITFSLCLLALSGCVTTENTDHMRTSREPVVVQTQSYLDITFDYGKSYLSQKDRASLDQFIMSHELDRYDEIYVDVADQGGDIAQKRAEKIAAYFKGYGLKAAFKRSTGQDALQTVRISLINYQVNVPNCPDWSDDPSQTYNNQVHSNFGCDQATNLAFMICNPRDLVKPQN